MCLDHSSLLLMRCEMGTCLLGWWQSGPLWWVSTSWALKQLPSCCPVVVLVSFSLVSDCCLFVWVDCHVNGGTVFFVTDYKSDSWDQMFCSLAWGFIATWWSFKIHFSWQTWKFFVCSYFVFLFPTFTYFLNSLNSLYSLIRSSH